VASTCRSTCSSHFHIQQQSSQCLIISRLILCAMHERPITPASFSFCVSASFAVRCPFSRSSPTVRVYAQNTSLSSASCRRMGSAGINKLSRARNAGVVKGGKEGERKQNGQAKHDASTSNLFLRGRAACWTVNRIGGDGVEIIPHPGISSIPSLSHLLQPMTRLLAHGPAQSKSLKAREAGWIFITPNQVVKESDWTRG
jgi:hypothetical protein